MTAIFPTLESTTTTNASSDVKAKLKATTLSAPVTLPQEQHSFPKLIYNDNHRSTAYVPIHKTSDDLKAEKKKFINSPLATNITYNWPAAQREKLSSVRSKSKVFKPVSRILEPSRPPAPYKVNSSWETIDTHFHNEKRALEMKRFQYLKEHTMWSIYPYARIDERETYNKQIRETLKNQMEQKLLNSKKDFLDKCAESKIILIKDKEIVEGDKQKKAEKSKMLNQYSITNKQVLASLLYLFSFSITRNLIILKLMEDRWMGDYFLKRDEWTKERELLNQTPINWSKTLK